MKVTGQALWQWRQEARQQAIAASIEPAELDWLLQEVADLDRLALRLESFKQSSEIELKLSLEELSLLWQRRLNEKVPVQYLVGQVPWRQFSLLVSPAVLIPRPETESLIDIAIAAVKNSANHSASQELHELSQGHWADLGTGSGAIACGLATAFPMAAIHAVDASQAALAIAQKNAQRLGLENHIQFYQGSWFAPLQHLRGQLSAMVSNPPYIPSTMIPTLQPEVAHHEPHLALDGGTDGLDSIRHLVATAPDYLHAGGIWLIEMMAGQADSVVSLLKEHGKYQPISIHQDLAGIDRFALAYRK